MAESNKNKGVGTQWNQGQGGQAQGGQGPGNQGQGNQGQGTAGGVAQMARDAASSVAQTASDQAKQASAAVAGGMHSLAGTIREHTPSQGVLGSAAGTVADTLESGSRYMQQEGFAGLVDDVSTVVRRNPVSSVLCCVGVGFVLGWMLSSSSPNSGSRGY
jgi:hypothetical protein